MSGVTPLLDTLLHQVLGKRMDAPEGRTQTEPVKPLLPSEATRAVHSDSRLDPRLEGRPALVEAQGQRSSQGAALLLAPTGRAEASISTHFSPAARTIADVLGQFPAPPSVVRTVQPLVPVTSEQGGASTAEVASRLASSIKDSGLFYEAHLARWFRGELPLAQLQREPQMRLNAAGHGLTTETATQVLAGSGSSAAAPAGHTTAPTAAQGQAAATAEAMGHLDTDLAKTRAVTHAAMEEGLQNIVRHQLELLVNPVLRWEGDVWTGLFMALVIQLPEAVQRQAQEHGEEAEQQTSEQEQGWRSELTLRHAALGDIKAQLNLQKTRLALTLSAAADTVVPRLEAGVESLRQRLQKVCGFTEVLVQVRPLTAEEQNHE